MASTPVTPDPRAARAAGPAPWREALLLALWLLATIGLRPLLLPDEGRYAGVAWEMLQGSPLVPRLDGLPFFHKPPLLYWLDLGAMRLLGVHAFAARLGPALLGFGLAWALFLHLRRWHGMAAARIGLVVLATSPLFFIGAQYVNHDIGVAACITAAVLAIVRAVEDPVRTDRRWLVAGWALCGLGVLAKGLIGIVLPAFVIGPWLLAQGRWRQMLALLHPLGLLAFAAVVLPWTGAMQWRYPGFFDYFIVEQHFRRFTGTDFNNHMPFWFFAVVLPALMLPWSGWLVALRRTLPVAPARLGLYLWWVVAIVGFFSLPASKLVGYVMPALAPMAALVALVLQARGTPWRGVAAASALLCLGLVGLLVWKDGASHRSLAHTLAAQRQPGDRVAFIDAYYYDVPFYARLRQPVVVVSGWSAPDIALHDNWRKELADAARFSPDRGAATLWDWPRLGQLDCATPRVWIVAAPQQRARLAAALPGLTLVRAVRGAELLSAPGRTCAVGP
ncbi:MAG: glycosyltransferase family 39 protein [Burkholderiales bacterium]|nr:glycosyltransferase family 39 protein [Burkholderiales bacterium]